MPLVYGTPQGRSATFSNAQGNQTAPQISSFFVYRISNYQLATITNELLEATKDNAGAFVDEAKLVMDTAFRNISNDLALDLFLGGQGRRGEILTISSPSTAVGATVIQLAQVADVVNFEVGMTIVVSATVGGSPSTDYVVLTSVNRSTGLLRGTASANPLSANWAATGILSVQGDVAVGGSTSTSSFLKVSGLSAWLPEVAPAPGDSFWNVDRSADPTRLAGVRYDGS
ncbi:MAG: hypothetical protein EBZ49_14640, partial [Proteobacteria bacterium]|nr:hypothetical protein [Pseudomonadota bacterium]